MRINRLIKWCLLIWMGWYSTAMWVVFLHQRRTKVLHFCVTSIFRHFKSHLYLADSNYKRARFLIASRSLFMACWREQPIVRGTLTDGQRRRQGIDKLSFWLKSDELHCWRSVTLHCRGIRREWLTWWMRSTREEEGNVESEREALHLPPGAKINLFFPYTFTETEQKDGFKHRNENNLKLNGLA